MSRQVSRSGELVTAERALRRQLHVVFPHVLSQLGPVPQCLPTEGAVRTGCGGVLVDPDPLLVVGGPSVCHGLLLGPEGDGAGEASVASLLGKHLGVGDGAVGPETTV